MPYYRRNNRRRRPYRKRAPAKTGGSSTLANVAKVATTALSIAKFAKSMLNTEVKFFDIYDAGVLNPGLGGNGTYLTPIPEGTSEQERNGSQVKIKSIHSNFMFYHNTGSVQQTLRVMIVIDKEGGNVAPASGDLLQLNGGSPSNSQMVVAPHNWNNGLRYKILHDSVHTVHADRPVAHINFTKDYGEGGELIRYRTGSNIAETTSVYAVIFCDVATNVPPFLQFTRIRYVDN